MMRQKKLYSLCISCLKVGSRAADVGYSMGDYYTILFGISSSNLKVTLWSLWANDAKAGPVRVVYNKELMLL